MKKLWFLCYMGAISIGIIVLVWQMAPDLSSEIQSQINKRIALGYNRNIVAAYLTEKNTRFFHGGVFSSSPEKAIFEIGSLTKLFTAHLTLLLAEEQLLSLDDPVQKYFPTVSFPTYGEVQITIRHLLTHTSGLKDPVQENYYNSENGNTVPMADYTLAELYHYIPKIKLGFMPGTKALYSNLSYGLIGHILEKITKKKYITLLREKIFIPFGMHDTFLEVPTSLSERKIQGTAAGVDVPYWEIPYLPAFGALKSTARDLAIYLRHYLNASPHSSLLKNLLIPYVELDQLPISGTIGWTIDKRYGGHLYAASGKTLGFSCFMGFCPVKKTGIIILTDASELDALGHYFLNPLFPLSPLYKAISLSSESLQKFSGTYSSEQNKVTIAVKGETLVLDVPNERPLVLSPMSENRFFIKYLFSSPQWLYFEEDTEKHSLCLILKDEATGLKEIFYKIKEEE